MTERCCRTCLFGGVIPADLSNRECKRHAPKMILATPKGMKSPVPLTAWPIVQAEDFCGDWEPDLRKAATKGGEA